MPCTGAFAACGIDQKACRALPHGPVIKIDRPLTGGQQASCGGSSMRAGTRRERVRDTEGAEVVAPSAIQVNCRTCGG